MKWLTTSATTLLSLAILLIPSTSATETCTTVFGSKTRKSVPSSTSTFTGPPTTTVTTYAHVTTIPITQTYIVVRGNHTTTIPLPPDFTPLTSATTLPVAIFAQSVVCNSTLPPITTLTRTIRSSASASLVTYTTTNTSTVATSTAYAACETKANLLSKFHGRNLVNTYGRSGTQACSDETDHPGNPACLNERTCCELAWKLESEGFYYQEGDRSCLIATSDYSFFSGATNGVEKGKRVYFGNGPNGKGSFGGTYVSFEYYVSHPGFS